MTLPSLDPSTTRRVPLRTLGVLSASVIALPLAGGTAQAASIPLPTPSRALPSALDVAPPYLPGTMCLTENQPGPVAFAKLLNATYGAHVYGVLRACDQEHGEGRALDWMLNATKSSDLAMGNAITRWLAAPDSQGRQGAMARRLGINYIIWNRQQWKAWAPERGWTAYTGSSPHTDHIHISFTWDGAVERTSWWTGTAVTTYLTGPPGSTSTSNDPKDYVNVTLRRGSRGKAVEVLQKAIGGLAVDGSYGPATEARVIAYQKSKKLTANGVVDSRVWNALIGTSSSGSGSAGSGSSTSTSTLAKYVGTVLKRGSRGDAVKAMQKAIGGLTVDGSFGPATQARVIAYQKSKKLTANGVVDSRVWNALMGKSTSTSSGSGSSTSSGSSSVSKYSGVTLRLWSRGDAVKAMQKAIGGLVVDGSFGPKTLARVTAWQKSKGLAVDGVIDSKDWKVLAGGSASVAAPAPAAPAAPSPSSTTTTEMTALKASTLRTGSAGSAVKVLQQALGGLAVDGRFGPATHARVISFQRSAGVPATGVVDRKTWDALERAAHPLLPYWNTVLKRGAHGSAVAALQKALRITADGSFGPQTEASVKAAQKASHLAQTGVVATLTWKAVEARSR